MLPGEQIDHTHPLMWLWGINEPAYGPCPVQGRTDNVSVNVLLSLPSQPRSTGCTAFKIWFGCHWTASFNCWHFVFVWRRWERHGEKQLRNLQMQSSIGKNGLWRINLYGSCYRLAWNNCSPLEHWQLLHIQQQAAQNVNSALNMFWGYSYWSINWVEEKDTVFDPLEQIFQAKSIIKSFLHA